MKTNKTQLTEIDGFFGVLYSFWMIGIYSYLGYVFYYWFVPESLIAWRPQYLDWLGISYFLSLVFSAPRLRRDRFIKDEYIALGDYIESYLINAVFAPPLILLIGWLIHNRFFIW